MNEQTHVQCSHSRGASPDKRIRIPCVWGAKCNKSSRGYRHPPVCVNYKSEIGCSYGKRCQKRHVDAEEKPSKRSKKNGTQGAVAILDPKKSILRKVGELRSNASAGRTVIYSAGTWYQMRIPERKGPSRGIIQKCEPHERNPCAPRYEDRTPDETSRQESCARKAARNLAKSVC